MVGEVYSILEEVGYNGRSMVLWEEFGMVRELWYDGSGMVREVWYTERTLVL